MTAWEDLKKMQVTLMKTINKNSSDLLHGEDDGMFLKNKNFDCLLSTVILFIEQEPFTNVSMNLDVNF